LYGELMSRIGKKPVIIPEKVKVEKDGSCITISGPLGSLQLNCHTLIKVRIDNSARKIWVENDNPQNRQAKELHGTMRSLLANLVTGVSMGFEKKLEIYGTGFNVKEQAGKLVVQVGFCRPVEMAVPKGIKVNIEAGAARGDDVPAKFTLSGIDKCILGRFAADIRKIRRPEPYKGKGIRFAGEHVRRKEGKAFTSGTA